MSRPVLIAPALLATTPAAAIALSIFGAFRLSGETIGFFEAWLAVAGLFCPLLALLVASARVVRRTMRTYAPSAGVPLVVGAALWALAALPATAVLGAMLKANTHHRALAGATFAALALVVQVGSALVAWRMTSLVLPRVRRASTRATVTLILGAAALVLFVVTLAGAALADGAGPPASSAARVPALLVDGALALGVAAFAGFVDVPSDRSHEARWMGGGALVFIVSVGVALAWRNPSIARDVPSRAPLAGMVADLIGLSPDP